MNDQSQLMNKHQVMSHSHIINQSQFVNQSQIMNQSQILNQMGQSQMANPQPPTMSSQAQMVSQMNQPPQMINPMVSQPQMVAQPPPLVNQSKMMSQGYGNWTQPPQMLPMINLKFSNQMNPYYGVVKPGGRNNWKGKKVMDKRKDGRRKDKVMATGAASGVTISGANPCVGGGYKPPSLNELEYQNRLKARRFYPKKKFNRMGPYAHAPRNTTSYIIRSKKSGGIASLVSPCPVTPAVLPTPVFSPSREALVDMAKEEWGVDGYGSMKGLIRLRSSPGHEAEIDDYEDEDDGGSSESDVEEHLEVERRLDHDLSRFEMIYPNQGGDHHNVLENRVNDQDTHIAQLDEENLILKERLYLMERELGELRRRLQFLERQNQVVEDINEEVVENTSENDSEGTGDVNLMNDKLHEETEYAPKFEQGRSSQADEVKAEQFGPMEEDVSKNQEAVKIDSKGEGKGLTLDNEPVCLEKDIGYHQVPDNKKEGELAAVTEKATMSELEAKEDSSCNKETEIGAKDQDIEIVKKGGTSGAAGDVAMQEFFGGGCEG